MTAWKILIIVAFCLLALLSYAWFATSTVRITRTLPASVDEVWMLWDRPEQIKLWWGPKNFTCPVARSELHSGGQFFLSMRSSAGSISSNSGTYLEVVPRQRIIQTMSFADADGRPLPGSGVSLPGHWPDQVTVTIEFAAVPDGTEINLREEGIPLIMKPLASLGWVQQFDKMAPLIDRSLGAKHSLGRDQR